MIFGNEIRPSPGLVLCFCTLQVLAAFTSDARAATVEQWELEPLMANLAQVRLVSAHFVERKYLQLLTQPLETSGTLSYVAPDRFEKITTVPISESVALRGDSVTGVQRNGDRYSVTLGEHPEIASLVEAIRSTLAGNLPVLERYYTIDFKSSRAAWQLKLTPRNQAVHEKIDDILIRGTDAILKRVEVHEKDGDRSEMIITPDGL